MSYSAQGSQAPAYGLTTRLRSEVDDRCAQADRLAQAATEQHHKLNEVKRQLVDLAALREADSRVRDRRQFSAAKDVARSRYHAALVAARHPGDVHEAARSWLRDIDRLNRDVELAEARAEEISRRAGELEQLLPAMELAADAARISAAAANAGCLDARRTLAASVEQERKGAAPAEHAHTATPDPRRNGRSSETALPAISLLLRGDRQTLISLARQLADESGVDSGRLQLLLLELREAIAEIALHDLALGTPPGHPFWGQFHDGGGERVIATLAAMGYRFDGGSGWVDGHAPTIRELVVSVSHAGLDPRTMRRPATQEAVNELWHGTTVLVEDYVAERAPELDLEQVVACLGPRARRLAELWDLWGRVRPLLLSPTVR